ncbi:MAG: N-acetylmuramoyl-L-alanine amidase [Candidatus Omnitrophica bacterium]|nr:N-acetylmuramoyl-L-alanine amidase [Candidatus Omnitrophota bacterium]
MKRFFLLIALAFLLSSCAGVPRGPSGYPSQSVYPAASGPFVRQDVVHVVAPGETIWRISKMYDVRMQDIMSANSLKSPRDLKMGQRIRVPHAAPLKSVVPLYRSSKWKYIIVHHTATEEGNALFVNRIHNAKGWQGIGYHFIIDNGTSGKEVGHIEASPRWIKQQNGAHCQASGMNYRGIGVCLVGNFSRERVSEKQLDSLVYLVNMLRNYYRIPMQNIIGHGQVPGARTECPGKYFPWPEFKRRLRILR